MLIWSVRSLSRISYLRPEVSVQTPYSSVSPLCGVDDSFRWAVSWSKSLPGRPTEAGSQQRTKRDAEEAGACTIYGACMGLGGGLADFEALRLVSHS